MEATTRSYRCVADRRGLERDRVGMVAVHAWDLHSARRAGLVTGWAARLEQTWADVFVPPRRDRRRPG